MRGLLYAIALLGPVVAVIFGTHALWTWLDANWGASFASMITAAAFLLLASVAAIIALLLKKDEPESVPEAVAEGGNGLISLVESAIVKRPFETVSVMVGLGALLARNPGFALLMARRLF